MMYATVEDFTSRCLFEGGVEGQRGGEEKKGKSE